MEDVTAIGPGSYTVTVTDNNGCTGTLSAQVSEPPQIATLIIATLASCADSNGTAKVVPSGGTPPYTYLWYNGAASDSIAGLSNGTYLVTITDFNGCTLDTSVIISNPAAPQIAMNVFSNVFCFNGTNGYIEIDIFGRTGPYTYNWNTSQTTEDIQNLPADTFTVIVTDQFGCSPVLTQIISQPDGN